MAEDYQFQRRYIQRGGQDEQIAENNGLNMPWAGWGWFVIAMIIILFVAIIAYWLLTTRIAEWKDKVDMVVNKMTPAINMMNRVQGALAAGVSKGAQAVASGLATGVGTGLTRSGQGLSNLGSRIIPFPGA